MKSRGSNVLVAIAVDVVAGTSRWMSLRAVAAAKEADRPGSLVLSFMTTQTTSQDMISED